MNPQQSKAPIPNVMVGLTHNADLSPIYRVPRVLKVGIGVPKGRACYIYTHQGRWIVRYGVWDQSSGKPKLLMATAKGPDGQSGFLTRKECQEWYAANKPTFALSDRPQKIPFFTFTQRTVIETKGKIEEFFEPDFDAIEAHGDTPRVIDIIFMGDNPLFGEYQAWSATELKCHGDGLNALRVVKLAPKDYNPAEGQKYFGVSECWVSGLCPYAQEGGSGGLVCKPMTTLSFQLANSIRLGATAYFTSTSIRSATNLFSSLEMIKTIAAMAGSGIANTPMKLVLSPFKTNHNGMAATQYSVSLEFRARDMQNLRAMISEAAWKPQPQRAIAAPEQEDMTGAEVVAEYIDAESEFEEGSDEPEKPSAQTATENKTDALAERLKVEAEKPRPVVTPAPAPAPAPTPAPAPAPTHGLSIADYQAMNEVISDGLDLNQKWRYRMVKGYLPAIGEAEFLAIIHSVTGGDISTVTADNSRRIWALMEQEKTKDSLGAPSGEGPVETLTATPVDAPGGQKKFF